MATTEVRRTYAITETANDKLNRETLLQELIDASLPASDILVGAGTSFVVVFDSLITSAQETTADSTVAAHAGDEFASTNPEENTAGPLTDDSGDWVQVGSALDVGPLPAGDYLIGAVCEIALQSTDASVGVQARLLVDGTERATDAWDKVQWHRSNLTFKVAVPDGQESSIVLQYQRIGAAGTGVTLRRARVSLTPLTT
jgi:hypothetical protein